MDNRASIYTNTSAPSRDTWPIVPLIRVITGYESGVGLVSSQLAIRDAAGCYRLLGGGLLVPGTGDVIETWEEMRAVPAYSASGIAAGSPYLDSTQAQAPRSAGSGSSV